MKCLTDNRKHCIDSPAVPAPSASSCPLFLYHVRDEGDEEEEEEEEEVQPPMNREGLEEKR